MSVDEKIFRIMVKNAQGDERFPHLHYTTDEELEVIMESFRESAKATEEKANKLLPPEITDLFMVKGEPILFGVFGIGDGYSPEIGSLLEYEGDHYEVLEVEIPSDFLRGRHHPRRGARCRKVNRCQFAEDSDTKDRCPEIATRKWGDNWFCDDHGKR